MLFSPGRLLKNTFFGKLVLENIGVFLMFFSENDFINTLLAPCNKRN